MVVVVKCGRLGGEVLESDGQSGLVKTYDNPLGTMAPAFADTQAFSCQ